MSDWLQNIVSAASNFAIDDLNEKTQQNEQIQQGLLTKKKIEMQTALISSNDPSKASVDTTGLSNESLQELNTFKQDAIARVKLKQAETQNLLAKKVSVDSSTNNINILRNQVSAGITTPEEALQTYSKNIAPGLQNTLGANFADYDSKVKSSFLLDSLKSQGPEQAAAALKSKKYIDGLTSSDYALGQEYIQKQKAEAIAFEKKTISTQAKIADNVIKGEYTPEEMEKMSNSETSPSSDIVNNTIHFAKIIKGMNQNNLQNVLKNSNIDPNLKHVVRQRLATVAKETQKNLVDFGANNGELHNINLNSGLALKVSLTQRVTDIQHLENKYTTQAKSLFTPLESANLKHFFYTSNPTDKYTILKSIGSVPNVTKYSNLDKEFYPGFTADAKSAAENTSGAIVAVHDSSEGARLLKEGGALPIGSTNEQTIRSRLAALYYHKPGLVDSRFHQIENIIAYRHMMNKKDDIISTDKIDDLIGEITGGQVYQGRENKSVSRSNFIARNKDVGRMLSGALTEDQVYKMTGLKSFHGVDPKQKYTYEDINTEGQFYNIDNDHYACVIQSGDGTTTVLRDDKGAPLVFSTAHLTHKDMKPGSLLRRIKYDVEDFF